MMTVLFLSEYSNLHLPQSPLMHAQTGAMIAAQMRKIISYSIQYQQSASMRLCKYTLCVFQAVCLGFLPRVLFL